MTGIDILRAMMTYIWPKGNPAIKLRVITALSLLVGAKVSEAKSGAGDVGGEGGGWGQDHLEGAQSVKMVIVHPGFFLLMLLL